MTPRGALRLRNRNLLLNLHRCAALPGSAAAGTQGGRTARRGPCGAAVEERGLVGSKPARTLGASQSVRRLCALRLRSGSVCSQFLLWELAGGWGRRGSAGGWSQLSCCRSSWGTRGCPVTWPGPWGPHDFRGDAPGVRPGPGCSWAQARESQSRNSPEAQGLVTASWMQDFGAMGSGGALGRGPGHAGVPTGQLKGGREASRSVKCTDHPKLSHNVTSSLLCSQRDTLLPPPAPPPIPLFFLFRGVLLRWMSLHLCFGKPFEPDLPGGIRLISRNRKGSLGRSRFGPEATPQPPPCLGTAAFVCAALGARKGHSPRTGPQPRNALVLLSNPATSPTHCNLDVVVFYQLDFGNSCFWTSEVFLVLFCFLIKPTILK